MDFNLNITHNNDIKILQITDMQVIDATQRRTPDRLTETEILKWSPENNDTNVYNHITYLVDKTTPDLIIITGDMVYGEFDDSGRVFAEITQFMDSFETPWAVVFGNHDNESYMEIDWQCNLLERSKYCMFKRGEVFGNGNYTIGIYQNDELKRAIFMMDSNGCRKLGVTAGFRSDQIEWLETESEKIHSETPDVPLFLCCHIPTRDFIDAYIKSDYTNGYDKSWNDDFTGFTIGTDVASRNGDFGSKHEGITATPPPIIRLLKKHKFDGFFVGHYHRINTSMLYDGVRLTFGLKTGYFDYHEKNAVGGTLIKLNDRDFTVEHIYYK